MSDKPEDTVSLFIEALQKYGGVQVRTDGNYTPVDRYRDFRAVFSTEAGQRVLAQITSFCEGRMPKAGAHPQELAAYVERRGVGQQIAAWATIPPREPPAQPAKKK